MYDQLLLMSHIGKTGGLASLCHGREAWPSHASTSLEFGAYVFISLGFADAVLDFCLVWISFVCSA